MANVQLILKLRAKGKSKAETARIVKCSTSTVARIWQQNLTIVETTKLVAAADVMRSTERRMDVMAQLTFINDETLSFLKEAKKNKDIPLGLNAISRIESQLKLSLEIQQQLFALKSVQAYQNTIMKLVEKVMPEQKQEFIRLLREEFEMASLLTVGDPSAV